MISITFEQCLSLIYNNLSKEEQITGITYEEINNFQEIFTEKLFNTGHINCIYCGGDDKKYTYGLLDWQNYYTFLSGTYRSKRTSEELNNYHLFNLEILLRDLLKSGFNELEIKELITGSIEEFLKFYRDLHKINKKKKKLVVNLTSKNTKANLV